MYKYKMFTNAILNEISIEYNILTRLDIGDLTYIPIRVLKSFPLIEKYKIKRPLYMIINMFYFIGAPLLYLYKLLVYLIEYIREYKLKSSADLQKRVVLLSNSRVLPLVKKIFKDQQITLVDINQNLSTGQINYIHLRSFLTFSDYFKAFFFSIVGFGYVLMQLKDKANLLQTYVAYDWFLTYIALDKLQREVGEVIFANHYDRWATMFDQLFESNKTVLIQHGLLPEDLSLSYKLKNLDVIYRFNQESEDIFKKLFDCHNTEFKSLDSRIVLQAVNHHKKSILIIGQPQSMEREIEIVKALQKTNSYNIYIKPHPLFDTIKYESLDNIQLIKDKTFFPRVDVALSYESTLGLEYESSGVKVIWYKDLNKQQIINEIKQKFAEV